MTALEAVVRLLLVSHPSAARREPSGGRARTRAAEQDNSWKMKDGRWKMEDGRWKIEEGLPSSSFSTCTTTSSESLNSFQIQQDWNDCAIVGPFPVSAARRFLIRCCATPPCQPVPAPAQTAAKPVSDPALSPPRPQSSAFPILSCLSTCAALALSLARTNSFFVLCFIPVLL
jgi:hypothetical protein